MLKRILPFILTLATGLPLGGLSRKTEIRPPLASYPERSVVRAEDICAERLFSARHVTERACILSKPEPEYTKEARLKGVTGVVLLRVVLSSTGEVSDITVVQGLPYGLTENALEAARRITFAPAVIGGRNVSQADLIEYDFDLY